MRKRKKSNGKKDFSSNQRNFVLQLELKRGPLTSNGCNRAESIDVRFTTKKGLN